MHNNRRVSHVPCVVFNVRLGDVCTGFGFVGWGCVMGIIKECKFTLVAFSFWFSFLFLSSWFTNECLNGVYKGCQASSGFVETFSVINMGAAIVFFPILLITILVDCK
ncbi:TMhelix containing protein [Vibrio phage 1.181.O._10N.286.46.C9]|nr:TMhelix containing protein [Vibrio phage 1.181.O._10N.286.46.C9]